MFQKSPTNVKSQNTNPSILRCTSQSRIGQRFSNSPLKLPLENAINKAMGNADKFTNSRISMKSRLKDERDSSSSRVVGRSIYKDEPQCLRDKMHAQTNSFVRKYFYSSAENVPIQTFIQCIMREYEHLWGTQNSTKVFEDFNYKIFEVFGENVSIVELGKRTLNDGMIGLILQIFKQIKAEQKVRGSSYLAISQNPRIETLRRSFDDQVVNGESLESIKNVVQQFMETMYQCMQTEIYNKFNVEMRRMVVKYREAERLVKKINERIVCYADVFDFDEQLRNKRKEYEQTLCEVQKEKKELEHQLFVQRSNVEIERKQNSKLQQEIVMLKQNLEKFQNAVLSKVMEPSSVYYDPLMQRKLSSNSMISENKENSVSPIKIIIDTHTIQKDGEPSETKTVATLKNVGNLANTNPFDGATIAESRYDSSPYSPYQSSFCRSRSPIGMISRRL